MQLKIGQGSHQEKDGDKDERKPLPVKTKNPQKAKERDGNRGRRGMKKLDQETADERGRPSGLEQDIPDIVPVEQKELLLLPVGQNIWPISDHPGQS